MQSHPEYLVYLT